LPTQIKSSPTDADGGIQSSGPLTIVVAHDAQRGIGLDNELPWKIPEDLAHFKRVTLGKPVIMGRKTFDSIGRPLPGRLNIVITRQTLWCRAGAKVAHTLDEAIAMANGPASIIGGAQIFEQAVGIADRMVITEIAQAFACDTFFPEFDRSQWQEVARVPETTAAGLWLEYVTYERRRTSTAPATLDNASTPERGPAMRALSRQSFASDTAFDIYCAEIEGWLCRLTDKVAAQDLGANDSEAALRVIKFLELVDAKLVAAGLTLEQRHAVVGALWSTRLTETVQPQEDKPA
jgi:dihydrofolate reductase